MIISFRHKELEKLFTEDNRSKIHPDHTVKLLRILDRLDASTSSQDMNLPGYRLNELKGSQKNTWSVWVSDNWRVTFQFESTNVVNVDYQDYH
jgi:toxin HigB-1